MEDVTELIAKVRQELGPDASDEDISKKVFEAVEALPESERAQVLEQLVKGIRSGQLRHLDKEVEADRQRKSGKGSQNTRNRPITVPRWVAHGDRRRLHTSVGDQPPRRAPGLSSMCSQQAHELSRSPVSETEAPIRYGNITATEIVTSRTKRTR